ncbi:MAG: hypothetical protein EBS84_22810 [Proteobacteria bacterium]|nr:hypothetical protein [Pseudomonadota bacterium]
MRNTPAVIIIGGDVRHFQLDKLRAALCTSLVVILCGLIRHQHARDITQLCRMHGRRLLRLHRSANVHAITSTLLGTAPLPTASDKQFTQQEAQA